VRDRNVAIHYIQAAARQVDFEKKVITCEACVVRSGVTESARIEQDERETDEGPETSSMRGKEGVRTWESGQLFEVPYDKLVIGVGCVAKTFKTPGVRSNALFLRDVGDARRIKRRVRECFELAVMPTTTPQLRKYLLKFVVVGAGPTGCELAAALCDFIQDVVKIYHGIAEDISITLYDVAPKVLSMFDETLSQYASEAMKREGVRVKTDHHIESLRWGEPGKPSEMDPKGPLTITTKEEGEVGCGMVVWATGNEMNTFINRSLGGKLDAFPTSSAIVRDSLDGKEAEKSSWSVSKVPKIGAILVDDNLRVLLKSDDDKTAVLKDVFALGDCCAIETGSPPATAQVAHQEAKWLAARLNKKDLDRSPGFSFKNLGMITYLGDRQGLVELPHELGKAKDVLPSGLKGRSAFLIWKGPYLGMQISWRNRLRILMSLFTNAVFGRDVSRY
jgi:NADH dehydrogenase